jgi:hypothetical protein
MLCTADEASVFQPASAFQGVQLLTLLNVISFLQSYSGGQSLLILVQYWAIMASALYRPMKISGLMELSVCRPVKKLISDPLLQA